MKNKNLKGMRILTLVLSASLILNSVEMPVYAASTTTMTSQSMSLSEDDLSDELTVEEYSEEESNIENFDAQEIEDVIEVDVDSTDLQEGNEESESIESVIEEDIEEDKSVKEEDIEEDKNIESVTEEDIEVNPKNEYEIVNNEYSSEDIVPITADVIVYDDDEDFEFVDGVDDDEDFNVEMPASVIANLHASYLNGEDRALPDSYSSVEEGYITAIRSQGRFGTCWAHATVGAVETSIIKNNLPGFNRNTLDLSEKHVLYTTYDREDVNDPLGNTLGDYLDRGSADLPEIGGNVAYSRWALLNWAGPVYESKYPYSGITTSIPKNGHYEAVAHVQDMREYPDESSQTEDGREILKKQIMEHGAVTVSYFDDDDFRNGSSIFVTEDIGTNHAVLIVGWDDNYEHTNFASYMLEESDSGEYTIGDKKYTTTADKYMPTKDGAWLIKNSWGKSNGDDGYFWMSYYDKSASNFVSLECESISNYDHNFFYDGGFTSGYSTLSAGQYVANVYTNTLEKAQEISAVGVGVSSTDEVLKIQIYQNPETGKPKSGIPLLDEPMECITDFAGFYTFKLPEEETVIIPSGDSFSVVVTCETETDFYRDYDYNAGSETNVKYYHAAISENTSFRNGTSQTANTYRIKAYTNDFPREDKDISRFSEISLDETEFAYNGTDIVPEVTVKVNGVTLVKDIDYTVSVTNNTDAGKATLTVTGIGSYSGSKSIDFNIYKEFVTEGVTVSINGYNYESSSYYAYTGQEIRPSKITVKLGEEELTKNVDYILTYKDDVDAGTATITATGIGNYRGSVSTKFKILYNLSGATTNFVGLEDAYDYIGEEIKPDFSIVIADKTLTLGEDYTLEFTNNKNAGTANIRIKSVTNHSANSLTKTFTIKKAKAQIIVDNVYENEGNTAPTSFTYKVAGLQGSDTKEDIFTVEPTLTCSVAGEVITSGTYDIIASGAEANNYEFTYVNGKLTTDPKAPVNINTCDIQLAGTFYYYSGNEIKPVVTIKDGDIPLIANTDYTIEYTNNIEPGKATITITGMEDEYTGTAEKNFDIYYKLTDTSVTISGLEEVYDYTGTAVKPVIVIKKDETELVKDEDYTISCNNNTEVGEAYLNVEGKGKYKGTISKNYVIAYNLSGENVVVTGIKESYEYTAFEIRPEITVTVAGDEIERSKDYRISYENNKDAGTASVIISSLKEYSVGSKTLTFKITPAELVISADNVTITEGSVAPTVYIFRAYGYLGTDTALSTFTTFPNVSCNVGGTKPVAGTYPITVSGGSAKNYTLSHKVATLTVEERRSISTCDIKLAGTAYYYNAGKEIRPAVTVSLNGVLLKGNEDYTVAYTNNKDAGVATVTITGKGKYKGTVEKEFSIYYKFAEPSVSVSSIGKRYAYSGKYLQPKITITCSENELVKDTDYTIAYKDNKEVGTATITIRGKGLYYGIITKTFDIVYALSVSSCSINLAKESFVYNGVAQTPAFTVTAAGKELVLGKDYKIIYKNSKNVGKATISINGISSNVVGYKTCNFEITKAPLVITADDVKVTNRDVIPNEFTYTLDGLVGSDTADTIFTTKPRLTCKVAGLKAAIGEYAITVAGGSAKNYELSYANGKVIVEKNTNKSGIVVKQKYDVKEYFLNVKEQITKYKVETVDGGKAAITKKGILTGKKAGKVKVTPYVLDGKKAVLKPEYAEEFTIVNPLFIADNMKATYIGQTLSSEDYMNFEGDGNDIVFSTKELDDPVILLDEESGEITACRPGSAKVKITFTNDQGLSVAITKTVTVKIPKLSVKPEIILKNGKGKVISIKNVPKNRNITWESSNPDVINVEPNDKSNAKIYVTALSSGTAEITATVDGQDYVTEITVPEL